MCLGLSVKMPISAWKVSSSSSSSPTVFLHHQYSELTFLLALGSFLKPHPPLSFSPFVFSSTSTEGGECGNCPLFLGNACQYIAPAFSWCFVTSNQQFPPVYLPTSPVSSYLYIQTLGSFCVYLGDVWHVCVCVAMYICHAGQKVHLVCLLLRPPPSVKVSVRAHLRRSRRRVYA